MVLRQSPLVISPPVSLGNDTSTYMGKLISNIKKSFVTHRSHMKISEQDVPI